jgi:hypothetical protein
MKGSDKIQIFGRDAQKIFLSHRCLHIKHCIFTGNWNERNQITPNIVQFLLHFIKSTEKIQILGRDAQKIFRSHICLHIKHYIFTGNWNLRDQITPNIIQFLLHFIKSTEKIQILGRDAQKMFRSHRCLHIKHYIFTGNWNLRIK